jgi:hypothetical protein
VTSTNLPLEWPLRIGLPFLLLLATALKLMGRLDVLWGVIVAPALLMAGFFVFVLVMMNLTSRSRPRDLKRGPQVP